MTRNPLRLAFWAIVYTTVLYGLNRVRILWLDYNNIEDFYERKGKSVRQRRKSS